MTQIIIASVAILFVFVILFGVLYAITHPTSVWFSYGNDPDPNCEMCNGTGVINKGDEHLEMECPCTERIYDC